MERDGNWEGDRWQRVRGREGGVDDWSIVIAHVWGCVSQSCAAWCGWVEVGSRDRSGMGKRQVRGVKTKKGVSRKAASAHAK